MSAYQVISTADEILTRKCLPRLPGRMSLKSVQALQLVWHLESFKENISKG